MQKNCHNNARKTQKQKKSENQKTFTAKCHNVVRSTGNKDTLKTHAPTTLMKYQRQKFTIR